MGVTAIWPGVWPTPVTEFVELPPLLVKITLALNVPSPAGVNRTTTLVEPKPGRPKLPPEAMLNGAPTLATPLLTAPPPVLVTTNMALAFVPTSTTPKFVLAGLTTMLPGVTAVPVRALVALPPLLVKSRLVVKVPACVGLNATCTTPVCPTGTLNGLPVTTLNGGAVVALPVSGNPPALTTWNAFVLLWPTITVSRIPFAGLTTRSASVFVTTM